MSKVLYVGHYRERSAWGSEAINYILAMDSVGIDVVCRPVKLGLPCPDLPKRILELEAKSSQNCDYMICHTLPHHFVKGPFKKSIGLYATETNDFRYSGWQNYINLMDEAWVICEDSKWASINSGVDIPINIVPHTHNPDKYKSKREKLYSRPAFAGLYTTDYLFYTIGEFTQRKNLPALIQAFHAEFDPSEDVNLLIKVNSSKFSGPELLQQAQGLCNKIKEDLRLYPSIDDYKSEIIMAQYLSDEEILDLHYTGDCFVSPSYGEAWSVPTQDAIALGKSVVCSNTGGMKDMMDATDWLTSHPVTVRPTPVSAQKDTFENLFTGKDTWSSVDIVDLQRSMREAYSIRNVDYISRNRKEAVALMTQKYSYTVIGNLIKSLLGI